MMQPYLTIEIEEDINRIHFHSADNVTGYGCALLNKRTPLQTAGASSLL